MRHSANGVQGRPAAFTMRAGAQFSTRTEPFEPLAARFSSAKIDDQPDIMVAARNVEAAGAELARMTIGLAIAANFAIVVPIIRALF